MVMVVVVVMVVVMVIVMVMIRGVAKVHLDSLERGKMPVEFISARNLRRWIR